MRHNDTVGQTAGSNLFVNIVGAHRTVAMTLLRDHEKYYNSG